jgi:hypothetical protein
MQKLFAKLQREAVAKPQKERLQTWALGDDPEPIIVFELDKEVVTLDLTEDKPPLWKEGASDKSNLRIVTDWETLKGIVKGDIFGPEAMRDGRLTAHGNQRLMHGLQRYFEKR